MGQVPTCSSCAHARGTRAAARALPHTRGKNEEKRKRGRGGDAATALGGPTSVRHSAAMGTRRHHRLLPLLLFFYSCCSPPSHVLGQFNSFVCLLVFYSSSRVSPPREVLTCCCPMGVFPVFKKKKKSNTIKWNVHFMAVIWAGECWQTDLKCLVGVGLSSAGIFQFGPSSSFALYGSENKAACERMRRAGGSA